MSLLITLQEKFANNPNYRGVGGLRSVTPKELSDTKAWLRSQAINFKHKTRGLPYNGVLQINMK